MFKFCTKGLPNIDSYNEGVSSKKFHDHTTSDIRLVCLKME